MKAGVTSFSHIPNTLPYTAVDTVGAQYLLNEWKKKGVNKHKHIGKHTSRAIHIIWFLSTNLEQIIK